MSIGYVTITNGNYAYPCKIENQKHKIHINTYNFMGSEL